MEVIILYLEMVPPSSPGWADTDMLSVAYVTTCNMLYESALQFMTPLTSK